MAVVQSLLLSLVFLSSAVANADRLGDAWLGVRLADADRPTIEEVVPDSPAAKAKLKNGDVFVSINGKAVKTIDDVIQTVQSMDAGDWATIVVRRERREVEVKVQLAPKPVEGRRRPTADRTGAEKRDAPAPKSPAAKPVETAPSMNSARAVAPVVEPAYLGIEIEESDRGLIIIDLVAGGPGSRSGLRRGDRLRAINGTSVPDIDALDRVMKRVKAHDNVRLSITRGTRRMDIRLVAAARPKSGGVKPAKAKAEPKPKPKPDRSATGRENRRDPRRVPDARNPGRRSGDRNTGGRNTGRDFDARSRGARGARGGDRASSSGDTVAHTSKAGPYSSNLRAALDRAKGSDQPVFVVFGADWCVNCEALKKTLDHESLRKILGGFERVWVDTDKQSALADRFEVESLPHMVWMSAKGEKLKSVVGYQPPQILLPTLQAAAAGKLPAESADSAKTAEPRRDPVRTVARRLPKAVALDPARSETAARTGESSKESPEIVALRRELARMRKEQAQLRKMLEEVLKELKKK